MCDANITYQAIAAVAITVGSLLFVWFVSWFFVGRGNVMWEKERKEIVSELHALTREYDSLRREQGLRWIPASRKGRISLRLIAIAKRREELNDRLKFIDGK